MPIGQVRFDLNDDHESIISVSIAKEHRNRGYGSILIRKAYEEMFAKSDVHTVSCIYKKLQNEASKRAFEKAGFKKINDNKR